MKGHNIVIKHKIKDNITRVLLVFALLVFIIYQFNIKINYKKLDLKKPNLKYILQWTNPFTDSSVVFRAMGEGQNVFLIYDCPVKNCYVTSDKTIMKQIIDFHAILFHGPDLNSHNIMLPDKRISSQKYVFQSLESPGYYPIEDDKYDNFFNLTWTYKLNSDIYLGYIIIKNKDGDVIGPKETMNWRKIEDMRSINAEFKKEFIHKNRLVAWFMSHHFTLNRRFDYVEAMQFELAKFNLSNLTVDIFDSSSVDNKCPVHEMDRCKLMLKNNYYFYLSFENSNCEDYVTEKLLIPLQNNAVPVVFGGGNYTRFLPDGTYLNARQFRPKDLVQQMIDIATNKTKYYDFFRWKSYYSYHDAFASPETNPYCTFCSKINEETPHISYYKNFRKWWNNPSSNRKRKT